MLRTPSAFLCYRGMLAAEHGVIPQGLLSMHYAATHADICGLMASIALL